MSAMFINWDTSDLNSAEIWTLNDDCRYLCSWNGAEETAVPDDEDDSNGIVGLFEVFG